MPSRRLAGEAASVGAVFAALAVAATWPLVLHIRAFLPSDVGDPVLNAWILGWDAARLRAGLGRLWDAPNFFPYRHTLLYSDHLLGIAVFTAPIQWLSGNPVLTYNVAYIGSWALGGVGMYVLARSLTGRRDAAWVAAAAFAFTPFRLGHLSHLQWMTLGWLPLSLWALHRYFVTGRSRFAYVSACFFLLQALTASYFMYFALLPIACVAIGELRHASPSRRRLAVDAAGVALVLAVAIAPIARGYYVVREQQGLRRSLDDVVNNSANLADYGKASHDMYIWRLLPPGGSEHELFPGLLPLALAVCAVLVRRRDRHVTTYAVIALLAFLFSLGPQPAFGARQLPFAGPYRLLLAVVPGLDGLRAPGRLAAVVVLALAVLAAFGAAWLIDRVADRHRRLVATLLVVAAVAEGWIAPMRLAAFDPGGDPRDRAAYEYIRAQPRGGLLELPTSNDNAAREFQYEYLTLVHGHPVVNGHSGYSSPLLTFIGGAASPFYEFDHLDAAFAMASAIGIRYILVHRGDAEGDAIGEAIGRAASAHPERVMDVREFGRDLLVTLPYAPPPAPPPHVLAIPAGAIRATASHSADRLAFAFDGDPDSRWLSGPPQAGDEWIDLAIERERDIAVVRLVLSERSFGNYPRHLAVDAVESTGTRTLYDGTVLPQFVRGLVANGSAAAIDVVLPPNRARTLRLRQTGTSHAFFWSVDELQLFERRP